MKVKRETLYEHLVEKQFNMIELTILDALFVKDWREKWFLTPKQHEKWRKYCIYTIKKILKVNTNKAKGIFNWLNIQHGLKIKT